jgi:hypothetical protein
VIDDAFRATAVGGIPKELAGFLVDEPFGAVPESRGPSRPDRIRMIRSNRPPTVTDGGKV